MSILFPSHEFFASLQAGLNGDAGCTEHLDPCEVYCGVVIGDQLFVLEFDGRECSAVMAGGNELDLDFVVAGPATAWRKAIDGAEMQDVAAGLPALVEKGQLEIRSVDDVGFEIASKTLPFLQIFLEHSRGLDLEFE